MKRQIALLLTLYLLLPCLGGCSRYKGEIRQKSTEIGTIFTFDSFVGTQTMKMHRENGSEGAIYYRANLTTGTMTVSFDLGLIWDDEILFTAEAGTVLNSSGGYIEQSGAIPFAFTADAPVSGHIILSFEPFDDYAGLPPYGDPDPFKGVEVYCWQTNDKWECGATLGTNRLKFDEEIRSLEVVDLDEMKWILATRGWSDCTSIIYIDRSGDTIQRMYWEDYKTEYTYLRTALGLN